MAASTMNPLESFVHLQEAIPRWTVKLDEITCQLDERFTRTTNVNDDNHMRRKKPGSTESPRVTRDCCTNPPKDQTNHSSTSDPAADLSTPPLSSHCSPSPNDSKNTLIDRGHQRKRKSGSIFSDDNARCRKSMIPVYYDSMYQQAFEAMVKNISTARNCLRKGKNAAAFKARLASFGMTSPASPPIYGNHSAQSTPKIMMPTLGQPIPSGRSDANNSTMGFIEVDRDLEEAQNLCENAAHQMLREGDCQHELKGMRKRFLSCAETTKRELERLHSEAYVEVLTIEAVESEAPIKLPLPLAIERPVTNEQFMFDEKFPQALPTKMAPLALTEIQLPVSTGTMEVDDDSSAESIQIDIAAMRRTMRRLPRV